MRRKFTPVPPAWPACVRTRPPQDAKKYCDAERTCQGLTFKDSDEPQMKLSVRFKSASHVTFDPAWMTYTKTQSAVPYFYQAGFLGDGKELHSAAMLLADAVAWCDKNLKCKGFSAEKMKESMDQLWIRFSDNERVTYDGNWISYTKVPKSASHTPYTYHPGYLGDGKTIHEAFMTIENAKMYCDVNTKCAGFTIDKEPQETTNELFIRFKSNPQVSYDPNFASYVKDNVKSEL